MDKKYFKSILEIENEYNLEFRQEFYNKYHDIILNIFNNTNNTSINTDDSDIQIINGLYHIAHNDFELGKTLLLNEINNNNLNAMCVLGVYYKLYEKNDKESMKFFKIAADKGHVFSSVNLAFEYFLIGDFDNFKKYINIGIFNNDEYSYILMGLYSNNILKNSDEALIFFKKAFNINSHRAYYEYSKILKNNEERIEFILKAIQLKPKKIYIDMLNRFLKTCENNYTRINYLENNLSRFSRCPICLLNDNKLNHKKELLFLKCNHSFCIDCIKTRCKNKCPICLH